MSSFFRTRGSVRGTCPSYFCGICTPLTEVGGKVRLCSVHHGTYACHLRGQNLANAVSELLHPEHGILYRYISVRQPSADHSSSLGSKLISSNAPTYDCYLGELLRSELTYLLTYLLTTGIVKEHLINKMSIVMIVGKFKIVRSGPKTVTVVAASVKLKHTGDVC